MPVSTLTLPRRTRDGSVTPELLADVHAAIESGLGEREAVVVCSGIEKENTARNRARAVALDYEKEHGTKLSAHAVPDPDDETKFVGAVTIRVEREAAQRDSRKLDDLAAAAEKAGLKVKGTGRNGKVTRADYINAGV